MRVRVVGQNVRSRMSIWTAALSKSDQGRQVFTQQKDRPIKDRYEGEKSRPRQFPRLLYGNGHSVPPM